VNAWYYGNLLTIQTTLTALLLALSIQIPMRMGVFAFTGVGAFGIAGYSTTILVVDHGLGVCTSALRPVHAAVHRPLRVAPTDNPPTVYTSPRCLRRSTCR